jgi:hypothetical protein
MIIYPENVRRFVNGCIELVIWLVATCLGGHAADIVFVDQSPGASFLQQQTKTVADFYGLEYNVILLADGGPERAILKAIEKGNVVAVVLNTNVLRSLDKQRIFNALRRKNGRDIPLLIAGIDEHTDAKVLTYWSNGAITDCRRSKIEKGTGFYRLPVLNGITNELGGKTLPMIASDVRYLSLNGVTVEPIVVAIIPGGELPVFVHVKTGTEEIFFATANAPMEVPEGSSPYREPLVFTNLAQQMMFFRYAAGERAWHGPGRYANLTIDDAWLREPYGHVNYEGLLREMEQHNFHTTIAFVPWNFDRSEPPIVSLLRAHADRFSICIHGNNHDHQEFGEYGTKPLDGQMGDIKQSLARMAKFQELTGLSYDPVMVFPHSISPEPTLALLKRYNFWATANSVNVPMGADAPRDPGFALRTATMEFANFPSLRRYSAEAPGPDSQLAVDAFLGNPMLFYVHQGFFAAGSDAFNSTADTVNHLQPGTLWQSLGYIAQRLYLEKLRDDGNYDIRSYSGTIRLRNDHKRDATFFIEKKEDFALPLTVFVDGQPYPYRRSENRLDLSVPIRDGATREITIKYGNDLALAQIDVSKRSLRIYVIRELSDFRDDVVSRTAFGRTFIRVYTEQEAAWNMGLLVFMVLLAALATAWFVRKARRHSMMA